MNIIRRWFSLLIVLITLLPLSTAFAASQSYIQCNCTGKCECFIQRGDEGGAVKQIIELLIEKDYLDDSTPISTFSEKVEEAVKRFQSDNALEETGMMDDDTLTLLLWNMTPEELDRIHGNSAGCKTVYIPTDGGKKRHSNPKCSKMEDPRKVSDRNAEIIGFDKCKKCYEKR